MHQKIAASVQACNNLKMTPSEIKRCRQVASLIGSTGGTIVVARGFFLTVTDRNSTAFIGIIILPFLFALCAIPLYAYGWLVGLSSILWRRPQRWQKCFAVFIGSILVATALPVGVKACSIILQQLMVTRISWSSTEELHAIAENPKAMQQVSVVNALVCNPNLSADDLQAIAESTNPAFYEAQRSFWVSDAGNRKGFSIMRLIDMHKNVQPKTLAMLSKYIDRDPDIVLDVVWRDKTPEADVQAAIDSLIQMPDSDYFKSRLLCSRKLSEQARKKIIDHPKYFVKQQLRDGCSGYYIDLKPTDSHKGE
jgi:hypothetical protein